MRKPESRVTVAEISLPSFMDPAATACPSRSPVAFTSSPADLARSKLSIGQSVTLNSEHLTSHMSVACTSLT